MEAELDSSTSSLADLEEKFERLKQLEQEALDFYTLYQKQYGLGEESEEDNERYGELLNKLRGSQRG